MSTVSRHAALDAISKQAAEIERLTANQERMWCKSCGTVTRDNGCYCTKYGGGPPQFVNYADAMQEEAHSLIQENAALREALAEIAQYFGNDLSGKEAESMAWTAHHALARGTEEAK